MSDGDLLLRAILLQPEEDTPRLAYADCLDENGQPERAEFIRWQFRDLFTKPRPVLRWRKWFDPWWGGATARQYRMQQPFDGLPRRVILTLMKIREPSDRGLENWHQMQVIHGFVSRIELSTATFLAHANRTFDAHPVASVRLVDKTPYWNGQAYTFFRQSSAPAGSVPGSELPDQLLTASVDDVEQRIDFDSWEKANQWLSDLCVAYGRRLAANTPSRAAQASAPVGCK